MSSLWTLNNGMFLNHRHLHCISISVGIAILWTVLMTKTHDDTAIGDTIGVIIEEALLVPETVAMLQGWKMLQCFGMFLNMFLQ